MNQHHLVKLLKSFSRKEMTRFVDFAHSPYHHKHRATQALISQLDKYYPAFAEQHLIREHLGKKTLGNAYTPAKLALLFTYAWRLAERFLMHERLQEHPIADVLLLQALRERRQHDTYERLLQKSRTRLEDTSRRDTSYYQHRIWLAEEASQTHKDWEPRAEHQSLIEKEHALDQYYLLEKLRYAVLFQVRRKILKDDYSARLQEGILEEIRQNRDTYQDRPAIEVYYQLYLMMNEPSLSQYQAAFATFQAQQHSFEQREQMVIYNYLQNFCISQINHNQPDFLRELFSLYQAQLERKLLHEEGHLIEWHYKNIVTTAIRLQELDWANSFIENYRQQLAPVAADNAYRFNKAAYSHAIGDYDSVLELLTQVEYSDLRYNLGAKALLLRTYYELNMYEPLHALVESFRQYLQRNRLLADSRRNGYYHLFRLTRRLAKVRSQHAYLPTKTVQQRLAKITRDIEQTSAIFNRGWLEEKVQEMVG